MPLGFRFVSFRIRIRFDLICFFGALFVEIEKVLASDRSLFFLGGGTYGRHADISCEAVKTIEIN